MMGKSGDNNAFIQKYDSENKKFIAGHSNETHNTDDTESFTMDSFGNVGIGTINPEYKLDITGSTKITNNLSVGNTLRVKNLIIDNTDVTDNITGKTIKIEFKDEQDSAKNISAVVSYNSVHNKSIFEVNHGTLKRTFDTG